MKQGKRLTYQVKKIISAMGFDVNDWLIKMEEKDSYVIINKRTKEIKTIEKG